MKAFRIPLRIVFYRERGEWIAHCLEFDLMGDGSTKEAALQMLIEAMQLQLESSIEHDNPANLFKPADGRILAMFAAGKDVAIGEIHLKLDSVTIDESQAREYTETDLIDEVAYAGSGT